MIRKTLALCLCVLGLAVPAALAQNPSQTGYGETPVVPKSNVAGVSAESKAPSSTPAATQAAAGAVETSSGKLPFTGLDLGLIVLLAVVLVGAGVGLRRATASRPS